MDIGVPTELKRNLKKGLGMATRLVLTVSLMSTGAPFARAGKLAQVKTHAQSGEGDSEAKKPGSNIEPKDDKSDAKASEERVVQEGISVEFSIDSVTPRDSKSILENADVSVRFNIKDTATGSPVRGAHPAAWMDIKQGSGQTDAAAGADCQIS